ncbi:hypothetical protein [Caballeronia sp. LZ034LL]|uniref:hypothetical protein n=1 Tax=Caballeronia sp. LZ034LL TaxID=3038567 RepID=UPI0028565162|nr:hypothetical protein [Caballeronia sp. LZ034LL]MDR5839294.1 hypothetical protein [Caballeronia sp. LZ034LL]
MSRTRFFQSRKKFVQGSIMFRNTQNEELNLALVPHGHLQAIAEGRGTEDAYLTVCFRIMVGASLTAFADDVGKETLEKEVFLPASDSLIAVGERYQRLGKFGVNGDELKSLKEALNLTDDLQNVTTRRQQRDMYVQVQGFVGGFDFTLNNLRILRERHK